MSEMKRVPLLWLDLDSTVRKGYDELGRFVNGPEDVEVFPEAVTMMRQEKSNGGRIVGVTNQGGIALGHVDEVDVDKAIIETNRQAEFLFDLIMMCMHHPSVDPCWCRKPQIGMLTKAELLLYRRYGEQYPHDEMLFVGDRPEDEECARNAGIAFQWAHEWRARA